MSALARRIASVLLVSTMPVATLAQTTLSTVPRASAVPPGDSLRGFWTSSAPERSTVFIQAIGDSAFTASTAGNFVASGFIQAATLYGFARFNAPVAPALKEWARFELVRASWVDSTTLTVTWISPLSGSAQSQETWRYGGPTLAGSRGPSVAGSAESMPKLGDYVFVEELPEAIHRVPPDYPTWARQQGVQGTVMVQALVGKDGLVKQTVIVSSVSGLDDYAMGAVKQWRFKPAMAKGAPVAVWVAIPVKFTLH